MQKHENGVVGPVLASRKPFGVLYLGHRERIERFSRRDVRPEALTEFPIWSRSFPFHYILFASTTKRNRRNVTHYSFVSFPLFSNRGDWIRTAEEVVVFLRLDQTGIKDPLLSLRYYRERGLLRGVKIGLKLRYRQTDLLDFLDRLAEGSG